MSKYDKRMGGKIMDFITCLSCVEKHKNKVSEENRILKDKLEFASEQADTFAKALVKIYDFLENKIDDVENGNFIKVSELKNLKNSIPKSALRRAE